MRRSRNAGKANIPKENWTCGNQRKPDIGNGTRRDCEKRWSGAESNRRHTDFQSVALPTELPDRKGRVVRPFGGTVSGGKGEMSPQGGVFFRNPGYIRRRAVSIREHRQDVCVPPGRAPSFIPRGGAGSAFGLPGPQGSRLAMLAGPAQKRARRCVHGRQTPPPPCRVSAQLRDTLLKSGTPGRFPGTAHRFPVR